MNLFTKPLGGWLRVVALATVSGLIGAVVAKEGNPFPLSPRQRVVPAMYCIARVKGGTSLRLAMVHDVLHERYLRHGEMWYQAQVDEAQKKLAEGNKGNDADHLKRFGAMDDLAVGLIMLHRETEAVQLMREKLVILKHDLLAKDPTFEQGQDYLSADKAAIIESKELSPMELHLYSAHANLGTALIHSAFSNGGLATAKATNSPVRIQLQEGMSEVEQAIAINPLAHFGRENWQAIAVAHLLGCLNHTELATAFSLTGQSLRDNSTSVGSWRTYFMALAEIDVQDIIHDELTPYQRFLFRRGVANLSFEKTWQKEVNSPYVGDFPFDEAVLGIVGMWTLGGGPNAQFALALGHIMESVRQNEIAWNGYERACEFPKGFGFGAETDAALVKYCRGRQGAIARQESPSDPDSWQASMRKTHQKELAWGRAYQEAYHQFEAKRLAEGVSLDDPHFYDTFFEGRPSIASPVGHADEVVITQVEPRYSMDYLPCVLLGIAVGFLMDELWKSVMQRRVRGRVRVL